MGRSLIESAKSPVLLRTVPFAVFAALTLGQGLFGPASYYWIYLLKTVAGAVLIFMTASRVSELRWNLSWAAVAAGIGVFILWVGIDGTLVRFGIAATQWNPHRQFGQDSPLAWTFVLVRLAGSSLVVPPIEEVFYRSFLYRYIQKGDFLSVSLGRFDWKAFLLTALVFGLGHREWVAGILCACAYQGLVWYKGRLGDAVTAHAITNFLLGLWVIGAEDWKFW
jgi:uncharacterized protein